MEDEIADAILNFKWQNQLPLSKTKSLTSLILKECKNPHIALDFRMNSPVFLFIYLNLQSLTDISI